MNLAKWQIWRGDRVITTVYFDDDMSRDDVKRALVNHDNLPADIDPFRSGRSIVRLEAHV